MSDETKKYRRVIELLMFEIARLRSNLVARYDCDPDTPAAVADYEAVVELLSKETA